MIAGLWLLLMHVEAMPFVPLLCVPTIQYKRGVYPTRHLFDDCMSFALARAQHVEAMPAWQGHAPLAA
jgi:hypothetical protein